MSETYCRLCNGAYTSPHHAKMCLPKPKEELILIASGLQGQVNRMHEHYRKVNFRWSSTKITSYANSFGTRRRVKKNGNNIPDSVYTGGDMKQIFCELLHWHSWSKWVSIDSGLLPSHRTELGFVSIMSKPRTIYFQIKTCQRCQKEEEWIGCNRAR